VPKAKKTSATPRVKVKDLRAKKNPTGGKKAKKQQEQYLIVKMEDVIISS
jgi:co-chaperonin GroES (HSP10)